MFLLDIEIRIDPDIGEIGPLLLTWHGLFTAIGIAAAVWLIAELAHRDGFPKDTVYNLALVAIPAGIIGARGLYVFEHLDTFRDDPLDVIRITEGGISVMGAMIGGALGTWLYMIITRTGGKALLADACGPGLMFGQAIGRIGDLINGEHWAKETDLPWAVTYNHPDTLGQFGLSVHPVAGGYELLGGLLIVGILLLIRRWIRVRKSYIFWSYAILYSIMRFGFSPLRVNEQRVRDTDLSVPQLLAIIVIVIAVAGIIAARRYRPPARPAPAAAAPRRTRAG